MEVAWLFSVYNPPKQYAPGLYQDFKHMLYWPFSSNEIWKVWLGFWVHKSTGHLL